ncbi:MAG: 16S rRNA (guanine(527)-N(7))-methyltransferase RsmG [Methylobacteriaceae bacterium]|nr:16S rRNA (guanine(527)-N(7))-methyltransferase RsmG [Methylobacteriaceae bacterium]
MEVPLKVLARDRERALRLVRLSQADQQRLATYQDLLLRWQGVLNLVSATTLPDMWTRHIADSAQLRDLAPAALRWVDLGSGAGFPGLVLAILFADTAGARVHLIERDKRKAAFLQTVSRETGAAATVYPGEIEAVLPTLDAVEIVTSRGLAPVRQLIDWSAPLLQRGATALFLKGRSVQPELDAVRDDYLDLSTLPSRTDSSGRIVSVRYKGAAIS